MTSELLELRSEAQRATASTWHLHPFNTVEIHEPLPHGVGPAPLRQFLAWVEELLLEHDLF